MNTIHRITEQDGAQILELHGFKIKTVKKPIYNKEELENVEQVLTIPFPEMLFGNNRLELMTPDNQLVYFDAVEALKLVALSDSVKVSIAEKWTERSKRNHEEITKVIKPYDWTYTTHYKGSTAQGEFGPTQLHIDTEKLLRKDPILFYNDVILYEDELGDNGCAFLNVRVVRWNNPASDAYHFFGIATILFACRSCACSSD
jgi:type 2A phosphatase activator TIP41